MTRRLKHLCKISFFQIAVFLLATDDALENDILPIDTTHQFVLVIAAFFAQILQPLIEIPMGFKDHLEVLRAAFEKEFERGHPVEQDAIEYDALHVTLWKILHQQ